MLIFMFENVLFFLLRYSHGAIDLYYFTTLIILLG